MVVHEGKGHIGRKRRRRENTMIEKYKEDKRRRRRRLEEKEEEEGNPLPFGLTSKRNENVTCPAYSVCVLLLETLSEPSLFISLYMTVAVVFLPSLRLLSTALCPSLLRLPSPH